MRKTDYLIVLLSERGGWVEIKDSLKEAKEYLKKRIDKHPDFYYEGFIYSKTWYYHPQLDEIVKSV